MASQELVKPDEFRALAQAEETRALIQENLQGEEFSEFDLARVKIPAGGAQRWEVPTLGGTDSVPELAGIVVFTKFTRSYWEKTVDDTGGGEPPDCSSADATLAQPREDFEPPAERDGEFYLCETCRFGDAGWGSGKGGRGQACKKMNVVFLLVPDKTLPLVLTLPPTSLKPARQYFLGLADYGVSKFGVVTHVGLEKVGGQGVPEYSRATFRAGERLSDDQLAQVRALAAEFEPHFTRMRVVQRSDVPADESPEEG